MELSKLSKLQREGIRELGNMGAGRASSYLAQLVDERIDMDVPTVDIVSLPNSVRDIPDVFGESEESTVIGVFIPTIGFSGGIVFSFKKDEYLEFLRMLRGEEIEDIDPEGQTSFMEVSTGVSDFYLEAINKFLSLDMDHEAPRLVFLPMGTLLIHMASGIYRVAEERETPPDAMIIKTEFLIADEIQGELTLLIEVRDTENILKALEERARKK